MFTAPIYRVETDKPYIAITFDDGPIPETSPQWIELLSEHACKATFFDLGKRVLAEPDLAREVFHAGHEIGNHSVTHPHLPELNLDDIRAELVRTQEIFTDVFGVAPRVFRAPYGEYNPDVFMVLNELKLPPIRGKGYADWSPDATVEGVIENYTKDTETGDIYVLHTWQVKTLEAMPEMIRRYKAKGLELVTVSELLASADTVPGSR